MPLTTRQCVEMFHLVFLRALTAKGEDKRLIALKGGCNLRFYFGSVRYSEDMDLDVTVIAQGTLRNKVERLLHSPLVAAPLKTQGIEVIDTSAPKQTPTTQRWKIGLSARHLATPLRTKVEFSRRNAAGDVAFEGIDSELLRPYGLTHVLATHYTLRAAVQQKIHALAGRAEPQARDVFDLHLLFAHAQGSAITLGASQAPALARALENAMSISFDDYRSKVVAFLDPDQAPLYSGRVEWNALQNAVITRLEALQ
jgi:hypothetical protein